MSRKEPIGEITTLTRKAQSLRLRITLRAKNARCARLIWPIFSKTGNPMRPSNLSPKNKVINTRRTRGANREKISLSQKPVGTRKRAACFTSDQLVLERGKARAFSSRDELGHVGSGAGGTSGLRLTPSGISASFAGHFSFLNRK